MKNKYKLSLLENSHNFVEEALEKAILAEDDIIQWKYAIFCIIQSIELILKEKLQREHPLLIYNNVDKPKQTVSLEQAIVRLKNVETIKFAQKDLDSIKTVSNWRNCITHHEFEFDAKVLKIAFANLLGFSVDFNKNELNVNIQNVINENIWSKATDIIEYAEVICIRAKERIKEEEICDNLILDCPKCNNHTFVIKEDNDSCYTCGYSENVIQCFDCNKYIFESDSEEYYNRQGNLTNYCNKCYMERTDEDDYYCHLKKE